jgi:hypothetical protein
LNQILCLTIMCLLVVGIIPFAISAAASSNSLNIFPPGAKPYGLSYPELIKNWWTWVFEIPAKDNPINDETGEKCSIGQPKNNSVFYLANNNGGASERTCKVPVGKGLLIPVMQVAISEAELPGASDEELAEAAKKDQDSVNSLYLKIDDKEYKYENLTKYRTDTEPFTVNIPPKAAYGIERPGPSKAVADGYYIITEPLAKGNHTIYFKSSLICSEPDCAEPNFVQDIKYNIIAE